MSKYEKTVPCTDKRTKGGKASVDYILGFTAQSTDWIVASRDFRIRS